MAHKRRGNQKNSSSKRSFVEVQSAKLHALCRNLVDHPGSPKAAVWANQSSQLVDKYLAAGADEVFLAALDLAADDENVFQEILDLVEYQAQNRELVLNNGNVGAATLFCVPVLAAATGGIQAAHVPLDITACVSIPDSLKLHSIIDPAATVRIAPYLYHHSELELPFSTVSRLSTRIFDMLHDPERLAQTGKEEPDFSPEAPVVELYYLLGAYVDEFESNSFGVEVETDEMYDAYLTRVEQWRGPASTLLVAALPKTIRVHTLDFGMPDTFFDAYKGGLSLLSTLGLDLRLQAALQEENVQPHGVKAVVAHYVDDDGALVETGVSLLSHLDGDFIGGAGRKMLPHEDIDDVDAAVLSTLKMIDIQDVEFVNEPVPAQLCDCCGEPSYIAPNEKEVSYNLRHAAPSSGKGLLH